MFARVSWVFSLKMGREASWVDVEWLAGCFLIMCQYLFSRIVSSPNMPLGWGATNKGKNTLVKCDEKNKIKSSFKLCLMIHSYSYILL